jgi:hypothetical protein
MSCWVVPDVAAELWGISVEEVMESVRQGRIPSRREFHFLLVDVAPDSPRMPAAKPAMIDEDNESFDWKAARRENSKHRIRPLRTAA